MVQTFYINILKRSDKGVENHGLIGLDNTGAIGVYADENLTRALTAMFRETKSLFRIKKLGLSTIKDEVLTKDPEAWLKEMRRQLPSPYYGGPLFISPMGLDQLPRLHESVFKEDHDKFDFQRLG